MSRQVQLGAVREAHRFDEAALWTYLRTAAPGFEDKPELRQFEAGQSNPTFLMRSGERSYVLRKKPPGKLLPKAHMIEREYRVMKALAGTDVPVPEMLCLCEDDSIIGTPFLVMQYVPGRVFFDLSFPQHTPGERAEFFTEISRVLAALHSVDIDAAGLESFGRRGNYFARQISIWSRQYQAAETGDIPSMNALMDWLPQHVPDDEATTLVHGDFRLDNLIFHPTEPKVVAVLDWELATLGHPLADLAYLCMAYLIDTPYHEAIGSKAGPQSGIPTMEETIARYCQRTGRGDIENWNFYQAFSLFRTAAILQGVYKRGLQGNASSTTALSLGGLVRVAGDTAWKLVS